MAKTSHFDRLYYCVKVPAYNSSVKFENYGSATKYIDDLESKGIRNEIKTEYHESQRVYKATLYNH